MSIIVNIHEQVSGIKTTPIVKTISCQTSLCDESCIFNQIAGSDGIVTVQELITYITSQDGLATIITTGSFKLAGIIKAAKSILGLH